MNTSSNKLKVTAIQDQETGVITAFINELPGLVVQAKTHVEVGEKLNLLITSFIKRLEARRNNLEIETQSLL